MGFMRGLNACAQLARLHKMAPSCHSRPQSPSFLGHVEIKPSGSGDENALVPVACRLLEMFEFL